MIERLLRAKHWHIFLLAVLPIVVIWILMFSTMFYTMQESVNNPQRPPSPTIFFPFFGLLFIGVLIQMLVLYGWQYGVIFKLKQFMPEEVNFNYKRIKFFAILPLVYFSLFFLLIASVFVNPMNIASPAIGLVALIIPLHFLTMFGIFHTMYFSAKTIKCVELKRNVTFSDMAGEFFLIWFFLIGVWILQPRINKLIDGDISYTEDKGKRPPVKPYNDDLEVI